MKNFALVKQELMSPAIKQMVGDRLGQKSGSFITSVLDLIGSENALMQCDPKLVMKECMKAASLDLPISKSLGFAYVIPYKQAGTPTPQFQMGYKGYVQLALRTGQYKHLNAGLVYDGEEIDEDRIKGTLRIIGKKKKNAKPVGYFSYMQLINGFEKAIYCTKTEITDHMKKYSKSHNKKDSAWKTDFDSMAKKTMILKLIPKYGPMSIQMSEALKHDRPVNIENELDMELDKNANSMAIDIKPVTSTKVEPPNTEQKDEPISNGLSEAEKAEILAKENEDSQQPDF